MRYGRFYMLVLDSGVVDDTPSQHHQNDITITFESARYYFEKEMEFDTAGVVGSTREMTRQTVSAWADVGSMELYLVPDRPNRILASPRL